MTVQVNYTNKDKSSDPDVLAIFADEKFQIKNISDFFSKNKTSYFEKILKNKKNTKESIISFNINEKSTVILISIKIVKFETVSINFLSLTRAGR